ncbi:MAG: arsenite methyltransferase [Euryarchaeota archaeon]|nr:arsenite methyltransferase [Euryarchaeota archaeon]
MANEENELEIRKAVRERYGQLAKSGRGKRQSVSCCGSSASSIDKELELAKYLAGYTDEQLKSLPERVKEVSAGCGNPTALIELREGDVVLDLGSGGGMDVFLVAQKVGKKGKAIGIDATPEMVWRAREVARKEGYQNAEFRLGEMECLPVESESVDVVISNCVINLSPEKDKVFKEAFRVLKPGGKLAVSDVVALGELPKEIRDNLDNWAGCIAGAIEEKEYIDKIKKAGFVGIEVKERHIYTLEEAKSIAESVGGDDFIKIIGDILKTGKVPKVASSKFVAFKPKN